MYFFATTQFSFLFIYLLLVLLFFFFTFTQYIYLYFASLPIKFIYISRIVVESLLNGMLIKSPPKLPW